MTTLTDHLQLLSDATRVRTLRLLEGEELSVGELASVLQLPQSTMSRHVKSLLGAGWLAKRVEGTASLLCLAEPLPDAAAAGVWGLVRVAGEHEAAFAEDHGRLVSILEQRRVDSRSYFGRVAGNWAQVRQELFGHGFTLPTLLALLPADWRVADLGCGPGEVAHAMAPYVAKVVGVDQEARMLETARARLENWPHASVVEADLSALPLDADAFDAALLMLVLHTIPDPDGALAEAARIVRPGGRVVVLDMRAHTREAYRRKMGHQHLGFSREAMAQRAARSGMRVERYYELPADEAAQGPPLFVAVLTPNP